MLQACKLTFTRCLGGFGLFFRTCRSCYSIVYESEYKLDRLDESRSLTCSFLTELDQDRVERRSSRSGKSRQSVEDEFLGAISGEPKSSRQAGATPSSLDSGLDSLKPGLRMEAENSNPLEGSFMRGFGQSRSGRASTQFKSPAQSPMHPRKIESLDHSAGQGVNIPIRSKLNVESNHNTTASAASSLSMDDPFSSLADAEVDSLGEDTTADFTAPLSDAAASLDLNEPYTGTSVPRVSTRRRSHLNNVGTGEALVDALNGLPRPPPIATSKINDSSPGTSAPGSGGRILPRTLSNEEGRTSRKSYPSSPLVMDSMDSPAASPSYTSRPRAKKFTEMYSNSNGSSPGVDEHATQFEVNMNGSHQDEDTCINQKYSDSTGEVWLTIEEIRLVTQPSASPPPSRAPPPPGLGRQSSHVDSQHSSVESPHEGQDEEKPELERQISDLDAVSGNESQQTGEGQGVFVMPEIQIVDLGPQMKPSREERRRMREHLEKERRRSNREEERPKDRERDRERERRDREGLRESLYRETEAGRARETPRPREGRREKVMPLSEPQDHQATSKKEQNESQDRIYLRQQEREFQEKMARLEEAREREKERKARKSAEKAALEARERAEKAAVERAVNEARQRAERAALQRAAAAKEQERIKEREKEKERRERERERDREQEKLRDRMREKEKGVAEQLRRDTFRATSEPRQRPTNSVHQPSGLSRHASGININNLSGTPGQHRSSVGPKAVDDWTNLFTQPSPSADESREIPNEPEDRRKLRLEKQMRIEERAAKALQEKNQRDRALQREQEERQRFSSNLDAEVRRWSAGKEGNLRALLSTLHLMLWPECNWKVVSLTDLITGPSVKKAYQKAILCVHPDKVQQKGANVQQKYIAEKVFDLLKDAYAKFNSNELY